ncbi:MAG: hypothetical protein IKX00_02195 [Bacilli bacterium]|nr:hypothetical protein [Bacilli bacterium]
MNKILNIIKYVLFITSFLLIIYFIKEYNLRGKDEIIKFTFRFITTITLLCIVFILNIIDLIKIKKINKLKCYNILTIIDLTFIIFILIRTLFDKSIVSNQLRTEFYGYYNRYGFQYFMFYCIFIIILLILNIAYFIVNTKRIKQKKH